jgi:hypothetical protein
VNRMSFSIISSLAWMWLIQLGACVS